MLQAPPELAPHEGAGGALMMALPMLGSVGSIVFVAAAPARRQEHDRRRHVPGRHARASSASASTGSASSARPRSAARGVSTSSTSAASARWSARPPPSSGGACCGTTPTRRRCRRWPRSAAGCGSAPATTRSSCRSATASPPSRWRWSWCRRRRRRSSSSTRWPPPRCTGCWSCTGSSPTCPPRSTCAPFSRDRGHRRRRRTPASLARAHGLLGGGVPLPRRPRRRACSPPTTRSPQWDWLKWLPHAQSTEADRRRRPAAGW